MKEEKEGEREGDEQKEKVWREKKREVGIEEIAGREVAW